jgi:sugar phosphate isomerase/epimerase
MYVCLNRATAGGQLSFEEFVNLAARTQFTGCDVDMGFALQRDADALRELFESRSLRFGGWGPPDWRGDDASAHAALDQTSAMGKIAQQLEIDTCCTWVMPSSRLRFIDNWNFHVLRLRPIADALRRRDLRLGLEFVSPYHLRLQQPHEFISSPGVMLELADAVGPNVGLLVDSFHVHASGMSFEHLAHIPAEKIVHVHINDCPTRELDEVRDGERTLPGEGAIDLKRFIESLKRAGYKGPLSLEVFSDALRKMKPLDAALAARRATHTALEL